MLNFLSKNSSNLQLVNFLENNLLRKILNLQQNNSDCRITGPLKYYLEHCSRSHLIVNKYLDFSGLLMLVLPQPLKGEKYVGI